MQIPNHILQSVPFQYAADVKSGKIVCGLRIKQAIDRFYKLIDTAEDKGYWLDHKKGFAAINFIEKFVKHTKGKSAGKPFLLSPYQQFRFYNQYAWQTKNENGATIRLIRNVYIKVAKKNGKTAEEAADNLYLMSFDKEEGAEIYVGATKEDQAKLCFNQAAEFVKKNQILQSVGFRIYQKEIKFIHTNSFMKPLGGDSKTQDGINAHKSTIDEYHAYKDDSVKENLESSSAARKQPITVTITTAGTNLHGVCKNFEESCINILEGISEDDTFLIMIHDLDKDDDWEEESNWIKANPNLGITVSIDFLRKEYNKAKNQPSKIPNFKTKHLNMWVDGVSEWIPSEYWNNCMQQAPILENFTKLGCAGAIDLSSNTDLSALAFITNEDENGFRDLLVWHFCPLDTINKRQKEDRVPYVAWSERKFIESPFENDTYLTATPGNMIDYDVISQKAVELFYFFKTSHIEYDRKLMGSIINHLMQENVELSPFNQSLMNFTFPTKEFERLVLGGKIRAGKNPVLKWSLSGCVVKPDSNENIRLHKGTATKRIDGIIASVMATAGTMSVEKEPVKSKYNNPDVEHHFG